MKYLLITLAVLFTSTTVIAQKIQVLSQESQAPIAGVALFNEDKSKSSVTNFDGYAEISSFNDDEVITFQHIAHGVLLLQKQQVVQGGNKVFLITDASSLDEVVLSVSKFGQKKEGHSSKKL